MSETGGKVARTTDSGCRFPGGRSTVLKRPADQAAEASRWGSCPSSAPGSLERLDDQVVAGVAAGRLAGVDAVAQVRRRPVRLCGEELGPADDPQVGVPYGGVLKLLVDPLAVGQVRVLDPGRLAQATRVDVDPVHGPVRAGDLQSTLDLRGEGRWVEDVVGADRHDDPAWQAVVALPLGEGIDRRGGRLAGPVVEGDRVAGAVGQQSLEGGAVLDGDAVAEHEDPVEGEDVADLVLRRDAAEQVLPRTERAGAVRSWALGRDAVRAGDAGAGR